MKPKNPPADEHFLFQSHFDQMLNPKHPLLKVAKQIDWDAFDAQFVDCYSPDIGAPGKATRLMVGLHYLKYMYNESDESVVARWVENPYWQSFCGYTHMQHECPIDPSTMSRWRKRVLKSDEAKLLSLFEQTINAAVKSKHLSPKQMQRVNVDTTVQEKNITHPTDSKLLYKSIVKLVDAAKARGIVLRQSYLRVGKKASMMAGRYAHAKQFKRMRRELRKLRTWVGRIIRDIQRKAEMVDDNLQSLLDRADRIRTQQPQDKNKLYSLHEPEVCCISKGKAHKRYEFGQKVSLATTNDGNWFVGAMMMPDNPYDGHTLAATLDHVESVTGVALEEVYVDRGYRGHDYTGDAKVNIAGQGGKKDTRAQRRRRKRRSAIEPKIGHAKSDHRMQCCYLKGLEGDSINAVLAAAASNLRKLLWFLPCALCERMIQSFQQFQCYLPTKLKPQMIA